MKKIIAFLICLSFLGQVNAQKMPIKPLKKWQVKFAPLHLINPDNPALQVGIQYDFTEKWAGGIEFGLPCRILGWDLQDDKKNSRYWKLRSEVKFFYKEDEKHPSYLSAEHTYIPQKYERFNDIYVPRVRTYQGEQYDFDRALVRHLTHIFTLKWGKELRFKSGFMFEYYVGGGIRLHHIKYLSIDNKTKVLEKIWREEPLNALTIDNDFEGLQGNPQFSLGFKIGYMF